MYVISAVSVEKDVGWSVSDYIFAYLQRSVTYSCGTSQYTHLKKESKYVKSLWRISKSNNKIVIMHSRKQII